MSKFLYNNDAKAIAIPQVFSENSRAKNKPYPQSQCFSRDQIYSMECDKYSPKEHPCET